jgi:hypothetical protein
VAIRPDRPQGTISRRNINLRKGKTDASIVCFLHSGIRVRYFLISSIGPNGSLQTSRRERDCGPFCDRWNNSLKTGEPDKVVANYDKKSTLLPTLSNTPRLTPEAKREYFTHFLEKKPVGKIDSRMIEIDCNSAIDTGLYTFTFKDGAVVKARYTFTYKWSGKNWLITSHHSSAMPEKS